MLQSEKDAWKHLGPYIPKGVQVQRKPWYLRQLLLPCSLPSNKQIKWLAGATVRDQLSRHFIASNQLWRTERLNGPHQISQGFSDQLIVVVIDAGTG